MIHSFGDYLDVHFHLHALVADGRFARSGFFYVMLHRSRRVWTDERDAVEIIDVAEHKLRRIPSPQWRERIKNEEPRGLHRGVFVWWGRLIGSPHGKNNRRMVVAYSDFRNLMSAARSVADMFRNTSLDVSASPPCQRMASSIVRARPSCR